MSDSKIKWQSQTEIDEENSKINSKIERISSVKNDFERQHLLQNLSDTTPQQIEEYIEANVTDLEGAKRMFRRILLLLATQIKD